MAIFTITNGESTELAVTKVSPVIEDCFTIYEYLVTTNNGDSVTIELSGNHYEAKYFDNAGNEISFSDTITFNYNTYLKVRFLLLNSGTQGVFSNATINIKNNTLDKYYENFVERNNDSGNCYDNAEYVLRTGDTMEGTLNMGPNVFTTDGFINFKDPLNPGNVMKFQNFLTRDFFMTPAGPNSDSSGILGYDFLTNKWTINNNEILTTSSDLGLNNYLPISGGTMQGSIDMDGDNILNVSRLFNGNGNWQITSGALSGSDQYEFIYNGSIEYRLHPSGSPVDNEDLVTKAYGDANYLNGGGITIDSTLQNNSTNPVENNAIFDALQLKANENEVAKINSSNIFNSANVFKNVVDFEQNLDFLPANVTSKPNYGKLGFSNINDSFFIKHPNQANFTIFDNSVLTGTNTLTIPDNSGTIALLSDITSTNINLGYTSSSTTGTITNSSGTDALIPVATSSIGGLMSSSLYNNVIANNSKISNVTHTGAVTGSTTLSITDSAVTTNKIANLAVNDSKLNTTGVISGSYNSANITVNSKGRITSASSNYITGSFTPLLQDPASGATYSSTINSGVYTKIGKLVTFSIYFSGINTSGTPSSNGLRVSGLPFTTGPNIINNYSVRISGTDKSFYQIVGVQTANSNIISFNVLTSFSQGGNTATFGAVTFSSGSLSITGSYITA